MNAANPEHNHRVLGLSVLGLTLMGAGLAAVLYFLDPATTAIYPVCYFHRFTGLDCPGCGGLRATHQLLHGHIGQAFRLNALVVLAAPVLAVLCARFLLRHFKGQRARFEIRTSWLWAGLALLVVFGILRNVV